MAYAVFFDVGFADMLVHGCFADVEHDSGKMQHLSRHFMVEIHFDVTGCPRKDFAIVAVPEIIGDGDVVADGEEIVPEVCKSLAGQRYNVALFYWAVSIFWLQGKFEGLTFFQAFQLLLEGRQQFASAKVKLERPVGVHPLQQGTCRTVFPQFVGDGDDMLFFYIHALVFAVFVCFKLSLGRNVWLESKLYEGHFNSWSNAAGTDAGARTYPG